MAEENKNQDNNVLLAPLLIKDIPVPVPVSAPEPLPVTIISAVPIAPVPVAPVKTVTTVTAATENTPESTVTTTTPVELARQPSVAPTTTLQEDKTIAGQRRINIIWEFTQAFIAVAIVLALIYLAIAKSPSETVTNAFFLIIGFYFSRTNHQAIGGIGPKANEGEAYTGRML